MDATPKDVYMWRKKKRRGPTNTDQNEGIRSTRTRTKAQYETETTMRGSSVNHQGVRRSVRGPVFYNTHKLLQLYKVRKKKKKRKKNRWEKRTQHCVLMLEKTQCGFRGFITILSPQLNNRILAKLKPLGEETDIYLHAGGGERL